MLEKIAALSFVSSVQQAFHRRNHTVQKWRTNWTYWMMPNRMIALIRVLTLLESIFRSFKSRILKMVNFEVLTTKFWLSMLWLTSFVLSNCFPRTSSQDFVKDRRHIWNIFEVRMLCWLLDSAPVNCLFIVGIEHLILDYFVVDVFATVNDY